MGLWKGKSKFYKEFMRGLLRDTLMIFGALGLVILVLIALFK